MLQVLTHETVVAGESRNRTARPTLSLTWELDPHTGKPVGRWIIEGAEPARFNLAAAA